MEIMSSWRRHWCGNVDSSAQTTHTIVTGWMTSFPTLSVRSADTVENGYCQFQRFCPIDTVVCHQRTSDGGQDCIWKCLQRPQCRWWIPVVLRRNLEGRYSQLWSTWTVANHAHKLAPVSTDPVRVTKVVDNTVWLKNGQRWNVRRCLPHRSSLRHELTLPMSMTSSSKLSPETDADSDEQDALFIFRLPKASGAPMVSAELRCSGRARRPRDFGSDFSHLRRLIAHTCLFCLLLSFHVFFALSLS